MSQPARQMSHRCTSQVDESLRGVFVFDVANLDTQEFMRGFLSPVDVSTIEYYLSD